MDVKVAKMNACSVAIRTISKRKKAIAIGMVSSVGGLLLSYHAGLPSGPCIILLAGVIGQWIGGALGISGSLYALGGAYLVLGDADSAQSAYDDAVAAYPQAFDRGELDTLALGAGLTLNGAQP